MAETLKSEERDGDPEPRKRVRSTNMRLRSGSYSVGSICSVMTAGAALVWDLVLEPRFRRQAGTSATG